jgi:hypothetical protein
MHAPRSAQTEKYLMRKTKQKMLSETAAALAKEPYPCRLWRMIPAEAFDESRRLAVCAYIVEFSPATSSGGGLSPAMLRARFASPCA